MKQKAFGLFQQGYLEESKALCVQLIAASDHDAQLWHLLGLIHAKSGSYSEAEDALLRALELNRDPNTLLSLGQVNIFTNKQDCAEQYFIQAIELNPDSVESFVGLANIYALTDKLEQALECLEKVVSLNAADAETYGNMALLHSRLRHNGEAENAANKSLSINPGNVSGNLVLSRLKRMNGDYKESANRLKAVLKANNHPSIIATVCSELGHTLDQDGEYAQAFSAYQEAKNAEKILTRNAPFGKNTYINKIDRNRQWFTKERVASYDSVETDDRINNLIFFIGFPRSGTTLVEQILGSNPGIVTTGEKQLITDLIRFATENIYASKEYPDFLEYISIENIHLLRAEYLDNLIKICGPESRDKIIIDKLPLNMIEVGFINRIFPEARYIMAYRDPRDVCLSCYMQTFRINPAMIQFLTLEDTAIFYAKSMNLWKHYKSVLDIDVFEYHYEQVIDDSDEITRQLADFVGCEWSDNMRAYYEHAASKTISTPSFIDVTSPIYKRARGRWKNYSEQIRPIISILNPYIEAFGYND
jgi:tetratricopeptide (TPR) repeat protein